MKNKILFIAGIIVVLFFFYGVNKFGAFDYDEAIYCEVVREMLESGDYIIPNYNYEKFYEKPILLYWLISAVHKTLSPSEISTSGRIVSAMAATGLVFIIYWFVLILLNQTAALLSSVVFATSFATLLISKTIITDTVFVFFLTLSIFSTITALSSEKKYLIYVAYAASGLAVLTKGPIGAIIPFLIGVIYYLTNLKTLKFSDLKMVSGGVVFCAITLPWFVFVTIKTGGEFFNDFFLVHNLQRFGARAFEGHSGPIFYYIPIIFLGLFPWSAFLSQALYSLRKHNSNLTKFLFIWLIVPFIIFSLSKTKLPNYILPVFPPIAVIIGVYFDKLITEQKSFAFPKLSFILYAVMSSFLIVLFGGAGVILNLLKEKLIPSQPFLFNEINLGPADKIIAVIFIAGVILFYFCVRNNNIKRYVVLASLMMMTFNFVLVNSLVPKIWQIVQGDIFNLSRDIKNNSTNDSSIVVYDMVMNPSVVLYSERKVIFLGRNDNEKVREIKKNAKDFWLLTKNKVFEEDLSARGELNLKVFKTEGGYILLR